jgi:hypothetical protein
VKITGIVSQTEYQNYIDIDDSDLDFDECWTLVKRYCMENNVRLTGIEYQDKYLPIIDNKYVFLISLRTWGSLMAEIWSEVDGVEYSYADWAWWYPSDK